MDREEHRSKPIPALAIESRLLIERLGECEIGQAVTYDELNQIVGYNVQEKRGNLQTAIRHWLQEGRVFGTIVGVGIKRLTDSEIVGEGDRARRHIGRTSRMALRKLASFAEFERLSPPERQRVLADQSLLGAIHVVTKPTSVQKLLARIAQETKALPTGRTLDVFRNGEKDS